MILANIAAGHFCYKTPSMGFGGKLFLSFVLTFGTEWGLIDVSEEVFTSCAYVKISLARNTSDPVAR